MNTESNTESNTEDMPELNIEITVTIPGGKILNFPEVVTSEHIDHELLELECVVPGFRYKSRADFHPLKGILKAYRRNEGGFLVPNSFECGTLHQASAVLMELFCQLQEAIGQKDYGKAATLLLFNLDESFVAALNLFEEDS
jgi:hypothetical protein